MTSNEAGGMLEEALELQATRAETEEMVGILVGTCGCGCSYGEGDLVSANPDCAAVAALRDRRYVLGLLFARRLRDRLRAEEFAA
jgi:hypothetical protein